MTHGAMCGKFIYFGLRVASQYLVQLKATSTQTHMANCLCLMHVINQEGYRSQPGKDKRSHDDRHKVCTLVPHDMHWCLWKAELLQA